LDPRAPSRAASPSSSASVEPAIRLLALAAADRFYVAALALGIVFQYLAIASSRGRIKEAM
jgi:hypothetical protein